MVRVGQSRDGAEYLPRPVGSPSVRGSFLEDEHRTTKPMQQAEHWAPRHCRFSDKLPKLLNGLKTQSSWGHNHHTS